VLLLALVPFARGSGFCFDMSSLPSLSGLECMVRAGYDCFCMRAYQSIGAPDPNVVQALAYAHEAGLTHVDVYMFPCPTCGISASSQFQSMIDNLASSSYEMIWFDIEEDSAGQYWSESYDTNRAFMNELISACSSAGKKCGVYSNYNNWVTIFGDPSWVASGSSSLPVWYADYDYAENFDDYAAFGGWETPSMKQFSGNDYVCGLGIDESWYSVDFWTGGGSTSGGTTGTNYGTCSVGGVGGTCISTSSCSASGGASHAGYCPGPADIQCCTQSNYGTCSVGGVSGTCISTSSCTGTSHAGYCPGPADIQCCTTGSGGPPYGKCSVGGASGVCISTSSCSADVGTSYAGYCPGPDDIECCIQVSCGAGGSCMDTGSCASYGGRSQAGLCPGPADIQCCTGW